MNTVRERLPEILRDELPVVRFEHDGESLMARLRVSDVDRFHASFLRNSEELETLQLDAILACLLADICRFQSAKLSRRLEFCGLELVDLSPSLAPPPVDAGQALHA